MTTTASVATPHAVDGGETTTPQHIPTETMRWGTLLVVLSGTFMSILDFFIVNVAIPSMQHELQASNDAIQWVVAGFALTIACLVVTGGRLGDLFGPRRIYGTGLAIFTLASVACGLAPGTGFLIGARVAQGAAAALLMPQVLVIIRATFSGRAQIRGFTAYGLAMGIAAVFGQLIGGVLIDADLVGLGWRACFLINAPIGLLALALLRRWVPAVPHTGRARLDLLGIALSSTALFATVLPLVRGQATGWPAWTWVSLGGAAIVGVEFLAYERRLARRGGQPLLDLTMFRGRSLGVGLLAQLAFNSGLASFFFVFALFVQDGHGFSAQGSGLLFSTLGGGYLITSSLAGRIAGRLGRQTVALGGALVVIGHLTVLMTYGDLPTIWLLAPALAISGAGMGLVIAPLATVVLMRVRTEHAGAASGLLTTVMQIGGAVGIAAVGILFYGASASASPAAEARDGFGAALYFLVAVNAVLVVLVQLLPRDRTEADT